MTDFSSSHIRALAPRLRAAATTGLIVFLLLAVIRSEIHTATNTVTPSLFSSARSEATAFEFEEARRSTYAIALAETSNGADSDPGAAYITANNTCARLAVGESLAAIQVAYAGQLPAPMINDITRTAVITLCPQFAAQLSR